MEEERAQAVRRVLWAGDGAAALRLAHDLGLDGPLQRVGELVLLAQASDPAAAEPFARRCATALRRRGAAGDQELADAIDFASGIRANIPELPLLPADLEQLADLLDGGADGGGGRLDLATGEVWPELAFDTAGFDEDEDEDEDRWLYVESRGSRAAYRDMEDFAATRADAKQRNRLESVLHGRGAFRRFKDVLFDWPEDRAEWFAFSEDRRTGRAREWLADAGYRAVPQRGRA